MNRPVPRGALVPIGRVRALEAGDLGVTAVAVSMGEPAATHVLVLGDPLPAALAASAISAGGRLLFGHPGASALAEGGEPLPNGVRDGFALKLKDIDAPLSVSARVRPLAEMLQIEWPLEAAALPRAEAPAFEVQLAPSSEIRPTTGAILTGSDLRELEDRLYEYPESRFRDIRFGRLGDEILLVGPSLEGIPGEGFHSIELPGAKKLLLPLGTSLSPAFARSWIDRFLDPSGDLHVWRRDRILAVDSRTLAPLTRRNWRGHDSR